MNIKKLDEKFFFRNARDVAQELLGKILVRRAGIEEIRARIVETEAYFDEKDPASRATKNGDLKETMKMKPGTILVYGVHNNWLLNFITREEGIAEAVLIRALEPLNFNMNTKGPGLLTRALKIDKSFHKKNIAETEDFWIEDDNKGKFEIQDSFRIGIRKDLPMKLRFYIKGNKFVSKK